MAMDWLYRGFPGADGSTLRTAASALGLTTDNRKKYEPLARQKARQYGIPEEVFIRMLTQESGWDPNAVNKKSGASGIAQFMPATAAEFGIDPMNPEQAIDGSARYLKAMIDHYGGDVQKSVAAYNYGPGNVDRVVQQGGAGWAALLPKETTKYIAVVQPTALRLNTAGVEGTDQPTYQDFVSEYGPTDGPLRWQEWQVGELELAKLRESAGDDFAQFFDAVVGAEANEIAIGNANVSKAKMEFDRQLQAHETAQSGFTQLMGYALPAGQEYVTGREPGGFWEKRGVSPLKASGQHFDPFAAANDIWERTPNLTQINTAPTNTLLPSYITQARSIAAGRTGAAPAAPPSTPPPPPGGPGAPGARTAEQIAQDAARGLWTDGATQNYMKPIESGGDGIWRSPSGLEFRQGVWVDPKGSYGITGSTAEQIAQYFINNQQAQYQAAGG